MARFSTRSKNVRMSPISANGRLTISGVNPNCRGARGARRGWMGVRRKRFGDGRDFARKERGGEESAAKRERLRGYVSFFLLRSNSLSSFVCFHTVPPSSAQEEERGRGREGAPFPTCVLSPRCPSRTDSPERSAANGERERERERKAGSQDRGAAPSSSAQRGSCMAARG